MATAPKYRVRLFLSVDLVGSTEFKTGRGARTDDNSAHQVWVQVIRHFYNQFPTILDSRFKEVHGNFKIVASSEPSPVLWKIVGDELIFCCKVLNLDHYAACVSAFASALEEYGLQLEAQYKLDVKGTVWVASFPYPNTTVPILSDRKLAELFSEEDEADADRRPREFDFLGRDIDTGFRVAKHAAASRLALSCEAAFLLCQAKIARIQFARDLNYVGREALKGVLKGEPYPIIIVDMERSEAKRDLQHLERKLTHRQLPEVGDIKNFVEALLREGEVELPVLTRRGHPSDEGLPTGYHRYVELWDKDHSEVQRRERGETTAGESNGAGGGDVPTEVLDSLRAIVSSDNLPATDSKPLRRPKPVKAPPLRSRGRGS